ncbi:hypothetical protein PAPYR_13222 [Paratrimastix pyriformis]|uniref:Uncharacterized protein n=1 Tax=Paratrimastix pyriformis TaxID=342808 RepID=A0ABQ8U0K6_9EUKA|nr:hypothetical protein PAPYR_13222 [Paratrimastix pyriformis]
MWQANLTEWYEENPMGTTSEGGKPAVGDNLKGHRWATPAGWGMDTMEENPKKGDNLKKEENPAVGDNLKGHRWATSAGDNLMREGAEENPDFGENLDGGMEDDAGDGNAAQAGDIGAYWLRWLGLASFCLRETGSDIMVASDTLGGLGRSSMPGQLEFY